MKTLKHSCGTALEERVDAGLYCPTCVAFVAPPGKKATTPCGYDRGGWELPCSQPAVRGRRRCKTHQDIEVREDAAAASARDRREQADALAVHPWCEGCDSRINLCAVRRPGQRRGWAVLCRSCLRKGEHAQV